MIGKLAALAALAGSAIGATVVLADEPGPAAKVPAVRAATATPEPTQPPIEARDVKIVLQTPDPDGGPPWAIRTFATTFKAVKPRKGSNIDKALTRTQHARCYQVGRLQGDRFGWIDGHGTFTVTDPGRAVTPGNCSTVKLLRQVGAMTQRFTTVTYAATGAPEPSRTITWGVAEPDVTAIIPDGEPAIQPTGPFLQVSKGESRFTLLGSVIERSDGTKKRMNEFSGYKGGRPVPGTGQVAARAPDPAGGEPWALIAHKGERGSTCLGTPGRLVGSHLGRIDRRLDVFMADPLEALANCRRKPPTRAFPMRLDTMISGAGLDDAQGRIERRIVDGRIVFSGTVHPDVVSVTITTPRDVRTLVPTKDFHAIVAVYAGLFPGGKATATARFNDGKEVRRTLYVE
jgi:hypothetical protein